MFQVGDKVRNVDYENDKVKVGAIGIIRELNIPCVSRDIGNTVHCIDWGDFVWNIPEKNLEVVKHRWNSEQIEGLEKSIQHWQDNIDGLKRGEDWEISDIYCDLCGKFGERNHKNCSDCPLDIIGQRCSQDTSVWKKCSFVSDRPIKEKIPFAQDMLQTLKNCLAMEVEEKVEFKIGGRVKVVMETSLAQCTLKDGIIYEIKDDKIFLKDEATGFKHSGCPYLAKNLELVKEKTMFKAGDRVKCVSDDGEFLRLTVGRIYTVIKTDLTDTGYITVINNNGDKYFCYPSRFTKEETMSKYDDLKCRIEALDNGWDRVADDLLDELWKHTARRIDNQYHYVISISPCKTGASINILGGNCGINWGKDIVEFKYDDQCKKMDAFKKALMWLLDNSDIKKEDEIKVGDWVVFLNNANASDLKGLHKIYKINDGCYYWNEENKWNCDKENFRKATPEEIAEHLKKQEKTEKIAELQSQMDKMQIEIDGLRGVSVKEIPKDDMPF